MVTVIDRIKGMTYSTGMELINTGVKIKKGTLRVCEAGSLVLYDVYCLEGFEKLTKALIANMKFLSLIPSVKGVFALCLDTLNGQRDLYYGTMWVNSACDFIRFDPATQRYHCQLPRMKDKTIDLFKILCAIGNLCETGKFLQRYEIYSFATCTRLANRLGGVKVWNSYTVADIPVLASLCTTPKDVCIFLASLVDLRKCWDKPLLELENVLKITGNIGKLLLISLSLRYYQKPWFVLIDVITQNASLIAFFIKRCKERNNNFLFPKVITM